MLLLHCEPELHRPHADLPIVRLEIEKRNKTGSPSSSGVSMTTDKIWSYKTDIPRVA